MNKFSNAINTKKVEEDEEIEEDIYCEEKFENVDNLENDDSDNEGDFFESISNI